MTKMPTMPNLMHGIYRDAQRGPMEIVKGMLLMSQS